MARPLPTGPPADRFIGAHGEEIVALSLAEIRAVRKLNAQEKIPTADGAVIGNPGDFVIRAPDGEEYPILPEIFYGTYQILGQVGARLVCRRSINVRRAWPVTSEKARFLYLTASGELRGEVEVARGSWVYQSDENDFGVINEKARRLAHIEIGAKDTLLSTDWDARVHAVTWLTSLLPPVMTLLALLALAAALRENTGLSEKLLAVEAALLMLGIVTVLVVRGKRWFLKSALSAAILVADELQTAAEILGQKASVHFPTMVLWRAAQMDVPAGTVFTLPALRTLRQQVNSIHRRVHHETERHHRHEKWAAGFTWIAAVVMLVSILAAARLHWRSLEYLAILLPSVVASGHAFVSQRQTAHRIAWGLEFLSKLDFVMAQLRQIAPEGPEHDKREIDQEQAAATLRLLCSAAAEHTQHQLQFALAGEPGLPV